MAQHIKVIIKSGPVHNKARIESRQINETKLVASPVSGKTLAASASEHAGSIRPVRPPTHPPRPARHG
jgi:hypothetical protein